MTGIYGKLPSYGDFVRRDLPQSFVQPWDAWLQAGLGAVRDHGGDEALAVLWSSAPAWRFRLPAGACGPDEVVGVLIASEDAVGRRFPLTVAALIGPGERMPNEAWYGVLEQAGLAAREQGHSVDALLAMLPAPDLGRSISMNEAVPGPGWWNAEGQCWPMSTLPAVSQFRRLLEGAMTQTRPLPLPEANAADGEETIITQPGALAAVAAPPPPPPPPPPPVLLADAATDTGTVRSRNEDAFCDRSDIGLWAVADGAGGHGAGDVASAAVVTALSDLPAGLSGAEVLAQVRLRLSAVHADLQRRGEESTDGAVPVTTVVVLMARGEHFACLWAGDSRTYLLREGELCQVTHDHSLVQELVESGMLAPEDAESHPQANVITRAVGSPEPLELDKVSGRILPGDLFLLCSDGLFKALPEAEIARALEAGLDATAVLGLALQAGARDNVTVVIVRAS